MALLNKNKNIWKLEMVGQTYTPRVNCTLICLFYLKFNSASGQFIKKSKRNNKFGIIDQ